MKKYRLQVRHEGGWQDVGPRGGPPFEYDTPDEASRMAYVRYGHDRMNVRVVEITRTPNGIYQ